VDEHIDQMKDDQMVDKALNELKRFVELFHNVDEVEFEEYEDVNQMVEQDQYNDYLLVIVVVMEVKFEYEIMQVKYQMLHQTIQQWKIEHVDVEQHD
jgi:hypothetical protein